MADKLRVGILGLSHDHIWGNLNDLINSADGELVAAADPHSELREQVRALGCEQVFATYDELLDQVQLDAVYIYADNKTSADLTVQAAAHGLHIMVEKPMASTYARAAKMQGAASAAGVQLMINWPTMWWPAFQHALHLIGEGRIGEIFQVTYRSAHGGPRELGCSPFFSEWLYDVERNGAGALMDYCCYGAAMTCTLLGLPARVTAISGRLRKPDLPAEDNAVIIMQHANALSTTTASWTQSGNLTSYVPMFYGSAGTLVVQHFEQELWLSNAEHEHGIKLDVPQPAEGMRNATEFFLSHIRSGKPITGMCSPAVSLNAQQVLEAGILSAAEGHTISLPLPVGRLL